MLDQRRPQVNDCCVTGPIHNLDMHGRWCHAGAMQTFKTLIVVVWVLAVLVPIATGLGEDDRWMLLIPILIAGWLYGYWRSSRAGWLPGTNAGQHLSSTSVITSHDAEYWDEVFRDHDEIAQRTRDQLERESASTAAGNMTLDDHSTARYDVMER